ncbi:hypothetical protein BKA82DRAFT_1003021 [Pisolithus tinctorius]|uniref:Uncharacterized protein n=1 Tax=Pisolithus tinctorius Marx 270 TaxID=870435 RepID=A0A0C3NKY1_PISTI|nr:hypothetical protein BKA82DRAFT_1003021 [Pisolithus tinctorius]KIO01625.1 hypothetical protein M404DRAFT_1003021 [Pisolithus tinctorius Marx 270]
MAGYAIAFPKPSFRFFLSTCVRPPRTTNTSSRSRWQKPRFTVIVQPVIILILLPIPIVAISEELKPHPVF